jgi:hypothetical protein
MNQIILVRGDLALFQRTACRLLMCLAYAAWTAAATAQTSTTQEAEQHYRVAQVALKNNDINAAADELFKAAQLAPQNALVQYYLAVVLKQQNKANEGLNHLRTAMQLGLPAKEKAAADELLAELTYALKLEPLTSLIGNWALESTSTENDNKGCSTTTTVKRRLVVPQQNPRNGTVTVEYLRAEHASQNNNSCTFTATGTKLLIDDIVRKGVLLQSGNQIKMQLERGVCSGDCLGQDIEGFSALLENQTRDEVTVRYDDDYRATLINETPSPDYFARKRGEQARVLSGFPGVWRHTFEDDDYSNRGIYTDNKQFKEHRGSNAGIHTVTDWDLRLQLNGPNGLSGTLTRSFGLRLVKSPGKIEYDSFTWNGREVTRTSYRLSYTLQGTMANDGTVTLSATYSSCSGDCGTIDNDRSAEDLKTSPLELRTPTQLAWTNDDFNPKTKVFVKQN